MSCSLKDLTEQDLLKILKIIADAGDGDFWIKSNSQYYVLDVCLSKKKLLEALEKINGLQP